MILADNSKLLTLSSCFLLVLSCQSTRLPTCSGIIDPDRLLTIAEKWDSVTPATLIDMKGAQRHPVTRDITNRRGVAFIEISYPNPEQQESPCVDVFTFENTLPTRVHIVSIVVARTLASLQDAIQIAGALWSKFFGQSIASRINYEALKESDGVFTIENPDSAYPDKLTTLSIEHHANVYILRFQIVAR